MFSTVRKLLSRAFRRGGALTPDQEKASRVVTGRIAGGFRYTTLTGYAGTGKTFTLGGIVERLLDEGYEVWVVAPTHKAVEVARRAVTDSSARKETIHALLHLRLERDGEGGYALRSRRPACFTEPTVVICDEGSMIGKRLMGHIRRTGGAQWLFVGDEAQLPPVGERRSAALEFDGYALTDVVRQGAGNPIIDFATAIRTGGDYLDAVWEEEGRGVRLTRKRETFIGRAAELFSDPAFSRDARFARVLAYRNETVRAYNREIRRAVSGADAERFVRGEYLVGRESWTCEGRPGLRASEIVRVHDVRTAYERDDELNTDWRIWDLTVRPTGGEGTALRRLSVLHEDEWKRFADLFYAARDAAKADARLWPRFYHLRERFCQVDYAFASTIHRAQGSSYTHALFDHEDASCCRGPEQRALLYVGATRATEHETVLI